MPNEGPSQEIKQEIHETPKVTNETKIDNPYSIYFSNPEIAKKIQDQLNTYKTQNPNIEKNFTKYLANNTDLVKTRNTFLEKNIGDSERCKKIINTMIDASLKEDVSVIGEQNKNAQANKPIEKIESQNIIPKVEIKIEDLKKEKIQTNTEKIQTVEGKEIINKLFKELNSQQKDVIKNHPDLKIDTEKTSQKLEESGTLKTLRDKGLSDENINSFISFKATQEAIKADPSIKDADNFLLSFKKLENELNIPDSNREDFSSKNIEHTSQELFNPEIGNQNLIDTVNDQKQAHTEDFEKLFDTPKDIKTLNNMYGKFLPESQNTYKAIEDKQQTQTPLTQTEQDFLNRFKSELEAKKTEFESTTSDSMEQASILGPIMGLADYMDMEIGNTFEFNKSNDIKIDNGMLSITGNIDNKPFTLETNLDKPSKLKTSDYLNKTDESNMGIGEQNRQETAYIMPAKTQIRENIKENFGKSHQEILKNTTSLNEYQETLKKSLCENIQKLYGFKDLVQTRIEKQMTKNIAAQETLDMLNTTVLNGKYDYDKNNNKNLNHELHNFLSDLDYSLEHLSSEEIDSRRQNIKELGKVLDSNQQGKQKNSCKILQDLSPAVLNKTRDIIERKPSTEGQKNTSLFTFFESLKDPQSKTYRIDEFSKILEENSNPKPNEKDYKNILENRNKKTADDELDLSLFISVEETTSIEYSIG